MYVFFQGVVNKQLFLNLAKQRLKYHFLQNWCTESRISTRASCYQYWFQSIFKCC